MSFVDSTESRFMTSWQLVRRAMQSPGAPSIEELATERGNSMRVANRDSFDEVDDVLRWAYWMQESRPGAVAGFASPIQDGVAMLHRAATPLHRGDCQLPADRADDICVRIVEPSRTVYLDLGGDANRSARIDEEIAGEISAREDEIELWISEERNRDEEFREPSESDPFGELSAGQWNDAE